MMSGCKHCVEGMSMIGEPRDKGLNYRPAYRILRDEYGDYYLCSVLGEFMFKIEYCPKCGRKLRR